MKFFKYGITSLCAVMMMSGMTVTAAQTGMVETQELNKNDTTGVSEVIYDTAGDQQFTVVIPKKIILGSDKTSDYDITVKGDVAQGSKVKVEPQDDVESKDGINFIMTSEKSGGSKEVDVTQNEVYWNYADIVANDYEGTAKRGNVNGSELTFGIWSGNITYLINFEDEYGNNGPYGDIPDDQIGNIEGWTYECDDENYIVMLKKYVGTDIDVTVHSFYKCNGKTYKAKLPENASGVFSGNGKIVNITFDEEFDTSNVTYMNSMFEGCDNLGSLDLSSFNTSNVTNMRSMFDSCYALKTLDLNSFNTSKVTDMNSMFRFCSSLQILSFNNFETKNVTNMCSMFMGCSSLEELSDLHLFDTSNVTDMSSMFEACDNLSRLNLYNFDTSNVTNMRSMFNDCSHLEELSDLHFDTSNVTNMSSMFKNCDYLGSLDLSSFNTSNVTNMSSMFENCYELRTVTVSNLWTTESLTNDTNMFECCGVDHVTVDW